MTPIPPISRPTSAQRTLLLPGSQPPLVLLTMEAARVRLAGQTEDDILALIEEGVIQWAWNIGLGQSREIRIWPESIEQALNPKTAATESARQDPVDRIIAGKPFIRGRDLRIILNCSSTHIIALLNARQLEVLPNTNWGTGRNGTPLITAASLRTFFRDRQVF